MHKKVLFVVNDTRYFVTHRLTLAIGVKRAGYEVHVAGPSRQYEHAMEKVGSSGIPFHVVPIERQGLNPIREAYTFFRLVSLYKRLRPHIVHHITVKPVIYGSIAARIAEVPATVNAVAGLGRLFRTGSVLQRVRAAGMRWVYRHITSRTDARDTRSSPLIVSVGRLIPEKGYADLIRSVPYVLKSWPDAKVDIYGEGPLKQELVNLIRAMDLNGSVRLRGFTSDPIAAMKAADVCVVSSVQEGFPNTLLEMMQSNTRVVSTLCADGIDRIAGLETCVPNDPAQLARAIKNALEDHDRDRARLFDLELARRSPAAFYDAIAAV